jgi:hypothetical protein
MSESHIIPIRLAQTIGLTTTAAAAGLSFSASAWVVPRILESPSPLLLRQWKHAFEAGKATMPPLSAVCTLCFGYLAYKARNLPDALSYKWKMYVVSGLLTIGIVPWTIVVMAPTNKKLLDKAEETSSLAIDDKIVEVGLGGESAHQLVDKWATLNLGRSIMLAVAAVLATWTTLNLPVTFP